MTVYTTMHTYTLGLSRGKAPRLKSASLQEAKKHVEDSIFGKEDWAEVVDGDVTWIYRKNKWSKASAASLTIGQTMVVHPMDAKDLQKKQNKKLQDRSFPHHEEPVEPKDKARQVKKQKQPATEVKVKKLQETKPW